LKKSFDVRILGQELSVISDSGDEHVASVIKLVSDKAEEAQKAVGSRNALDIAILTALNIAEEYLQIVEKKEDKQNLLESRTEQLIHLINNVR
jgi:cell division protein ZapA